MTRITMISGEAFGHLANHRGIVSLRGLTTLTPAMAEQLDKCAKR